MERNETTLPRRMKEAKPFAQHGSQKMIYDIRMGPQGLYHEGAFYVTYQANPHGNKALPHVLRRYPDGTWSAPVVLGDVSNYDHHFAPVLWLDQDRHFHVLYHCHSTLHGAIHKVSNKPLDITRWQNGPRIAPSLSYPRILKSISGKLLLYYRALGHMGYWTYQLSDDGGYSWTGPEVPLVDFDHNPRFPGDEWAGTYHSVVLGHGGQSLHIAFVYWDERNRPHPLYGERVGTRNRCNLYYLRLDLSSGLLYNVDGKQLQQPVNHEDARECLVWDTEGCLTNMPTIIIDNENRPNFLMVASGETLDDCCFWFIKREDGQWDRYQVTETNDVWNGGHLEYAGDGSLSAFLIARPTQYGNLPYGGGVLQEWDSKDNGESWGMAQEISLKQNFLCNNLKAVEDEQGSPLSRTLLLFGWQGPDGILPNGDFRGHAYLWQNGRWL